MKKIFISVILFAGLAQCCVAQISDERDAWGNLFAPIVAIQAIVSQNDKVESSVIQKFQNSCYTGFSYANNVQFIDRSNPYGSTTNAPTPQYLLKIVLHNFEYLPREESSSAIGDAYASMTFSLISVETSAILKQETVALYASDDTSFSKFEQGSSIEILVYGQTIKAAQIFGNSLFDTVFAVKEIVQYDDDWAEWVALEDKQLDKIRYKEGLFAVAVKKEYTRDSIVYRWTTPVGKMYQGTFEGKNDKRFFQVAENSNQKAMKRAFKDKCKVFGVR